mgnify:FL=1
MSDPPSLASVLVRRAPGLRHLGGCLKDGGASWTRLPPLTSLRLEYQCRETINLVGVLSQVQPSLRQLELSRHPSSVAAVAPLLPSLESLHLGTNPQNTPSFSLLFQSLSSAHSLRHLHLHPRRLPATLLASIPPGLATLSFTPSVGDDGRRRLLRACIKTLAVLKQRPPLPLRVEFAVETEGEQVALLTRFAGEYAARGSTLVVSVVKII